MFYCVKDEDAVCYLIIAAPYFLSINDQRRKVTSSVFLKKNHSQVRGIDWGAYLYSVVRETP